MTFLNPLALLGLLAAAIPILLHLFNLRKLRTVEFSTLTFLKELEKTKIRRLKVRQILLMILRTLLVLLIVLAFARPTLRGSLAGSVGSHARTSAVILIDDSFSMTTEDERGELLKQARTAAKNLSQLLGDGDEAFLIPFSTLSDPTRNEYTPIHDLAALRKQIDGIKPSPVHRPLEQGLRVAARILTGAQNFNKELYVISDLQEGVVMGESNAAGAAEKLFPSEVRFFLVTLGKRELQNFAIESVTIPSSIFEPHRTFSIQARVANYSAADAQDRVVSVFLNGTRVSERGIDIPRNASVPVDFSVAPDGTGFIDGFVELEHDDVEYDNSRHFALRIPATTKILIVGTPDDTQLLRLALAADTGSGSGLRIEAVMPERLSSVEIRRSDVILLGTTSRLTSAQISELSAFARSGGGIVIFPSSKIDPASFNAQFVSGMGTLQLEGIDRPAGGAGSTSFIEFDKADLRHPLFEGVFESSPDGGPRQPSTEPISTMKLESPRIRASARFGLTAQSNAIITMSNGAPFLAEQASGSGRLLLFAVPATTEWSDFPTRGIFVPLLHRSVLYLAQQQARAVEALPGSEVILRVSTAAAGPWEVHTPQQLTLPLTPTVQLFQQLFHFDATDQPGIYSLLAHGSLVQKFVINLDARESRTVKATSDELDELLARVGIQHSALRTVKNAEHLQQTVLQSRFGVELWKYFVMFALIVAVIEVLVGRTWKRELSLAGTHD